MQLNLPKSVSSYDCADIFGGFLITKRMLDLFRRATDPPEYAWLYAIPAAVFSGGFVWAASTGLGGLVMSGYFVSTMLSIGALSGLASQASHITHDISPHALSNTSTNSTSQQHERATPWGC